MKKHPLKHDNGLSPDSRVSPITPEGIRDQLDRVLSSQNLRASGNVTTIFRYLTEESLAGRDDQVNVQKTANKAPNRSLDPDSSIDPLLRIRVNQIRRALKG